MAYIFGVFACCHICLEYLGKVSSLQYFLFVCRKRIIKYTKKKHRENIVEWNSYKEHSKLNIESEVGAYQAIRLARTTN